jgi:phospholipase/carboxylesterase
LTKGIEEGKSIAASLQHRVFFPSTAREKYPAIIAIHGRGTNENDLVPLVLSLSLPNVLLVSPRAPFPFLYGGFVWYDITHDGIPEPNTFRTSIDMLQKFVGEVKQGYPVDAERLLLLGFSQGTAMAYATALLDPTSFLGVAALSGYIPHQSGLPLKLTNLNGFPVFISHGSDDPIIPARLGRESAELLKRAGATVTYREYPMGHEVTEDTMHDLSEWSRNIFS